MSGNASVIFVESKQKTMHQGNIVKSAKSNILFLGGGSASYLGQSDLVLGPQ